jgi:hypothetical protein
VKLQNIGTKKRRKKLANSKDVHGAGFISGRSCSSAALSLELDLDSLMLIESKQHDYKNNHELFQALTDKAYIKRMIAEDYYDPSFYTCKHDNDGFELRSNELFIDDYFEYPFYPDRD